jgi:hypothetical protein
LFEVLLHMAADSMTLDAVIATLSAQANLDGRGSEILAAAITLRDSTGRDRKQSLRAMCGVWCVQRQERISGKWKDRGVATLHGLLTCSVCMAAARWHPEAPKQTEQPGVSGHASSVSNRAGPEHRGVTEHASPGCSATGLQQSGQKQRSNPEHVVSDMREQLEKSGAAEHAPPESSKICPVAKSAGNATAKLMIQIGKPFKRKNWLMASQERSRSRISVRAQLTSTQASVSA